MKRIKTVPRNRLKTNTPEQLMFFSIKGPSADRFDFGKAADKWVDYTIIEFTGKIDYLFTCNMVVCCCKSKLYCTDNIFHINMNH